MKRTGREAIQEHLARTCRAIQQVESAQIDGLCRLLLAALRGRKRIFIFGNGGSGATASHFSQDLGKGTLADTEQTERFRVIALTDSMAVILAWANDSGYEQIFEQQLRNLADPGDLAIALSGSGKSPNVLRAIRYADQLGMETVGLTGYDGGELRTLVKQSIHVDLNDMEVVETVHAAITHAVVSTLRKQLNDESSLY